MKTKLFLITMTLAALAFSCKNEVDEDRTGRFEEMSFTATSESIVTKTSVEMPNISWLEKDSISVFDGKANNKFTNAQGGVSATFSGVANAKSDTFVALYPYKEGIGR